MVHFDGETWVKIVQNQKFSIYFQIVLIVILKKLSILSLN
jgi:hypothetical protein